MQESMLPHIIDELVEIPQFPKQMFSIRDFYEFVKTVDPTKVIQHRDEHGDNSWRYCAFGAFVKWRFRISDAEWDFDYTEISSAAMLAIMNLGKESDGWTTFVWKFRHLLTDSMDLPETYGELVKCIEEVFPRLTEKHYA